MFQTNVKRAYTTGFPGDVSRDGPIRAKPARINSVTLGVDPGASTNRISRAFGFTSDIAATGTTLSATEALVDVGGPKFFGVLFHPKHYASYGTVGNTLAPTLDLPQGVVAEFADMVELIAEVFNETTGTKTVTFGDSIAYVPNNIIVGNNPNALPYGALVSYSGALPTGMVAIPNARVINAVSLAASAPGAVVSGYTIIQLTQ